MCKTQYIFVMTLLKREYIIKIVLHLHAGKVEIQRNKRIVISNTMNLFLDYCDHRSLKLQPSSSFFFFFLGLD